MSTVRNINRGGLSNKLESQWERAEADVAVIYPTVQTSLLDIEEGTDLSEEDKAEQIDVIIASAEKKLGPKVTKDLKNLSRTLRSEDVGPLMKEAPGKESQTLTPLDHKKRKPVSKAFQTGDSRAVEKQVSKANREYAGQEIEDSFSKQL